MKSICHYSLFFYRPSPFSFFCGMLPSPTFCCVPSQFVSWSAQPLEPPSETYVSALHDMWSTKARKLPMALFVFFTINYQEFKHTIARSEQTFSNCSMYKRPSVYSFGIAWYPYFAPRMAHATAAFVSASPPAFTTASSPSSKEEVCQYAHRATDNVTKVYPMWS